MSEQKREVGHGMDRSGKELTDAQRYALSRRTIPTSKSLEYLSKENAKRNGRVHENLLSKSGGREIAKKIISGIEQGLPLKMAAQRAKVSPYSLTRWIRIGQAVYAQLCEMGMDEINAIEGELKQYFTPAEKAVYELMLDIKRAEAQCIHRATLSVVTAQADHWQAAAWFLDRRGGEAFDKQNSPSTVVNVSQQNQQIQTSNQLNVAFESTVKELSIDEKKTLLATFAKMKQATAPAEASTNV